MTITFDDKDRAVVVLKLQGADITATSKRVDDVLHNVEAAFLQQFDEEADYMINEFEADQ